jgi:hypothetical protein
MLARVLAIALFGVAAIAAPLPAEEAAKPGPIGFLGPLLVGEAALGAAALGAGALGAGALASGATGAVLGSGLRRGRPQVVVVPAGSNGPYQAGPPQGPYRAGPPQGPYRQGPYRPL